MIISLIYLGLFSRIASYLITLGLSFIGLSYVILYVGAVSILFLFILMLIYIKIRWGEYISHVVSRYFSRLKCTLMSFEINYKVLSLSKQIHIYISYSTLMVKNSFASVAKKPKVQLNPYFVTGFIYASTTTLPQNLIRQYRKKAGGLLQEMTNSTSLVVWGQNLTSHVGVKYTHKELALVKLAHYQYSVIVGLVLSDGSIRFASKISKNALLIFKQSKTHNEYVWFVFNSLSHYCSSTPKITTGIRLGKRYWALQFFTRSMPCITELYYLFYPNKVKVIP